VRIEKSPVGVEAAADPDEIVIAGKQTLESVGSHEVDLPPMRTASMLRKEAVARAEVRPVVRPGLTGDRNDQIVALVIGR
jgi:hypothetical protein